MINKLEERPIQERFEHLIRFMKSEKFLKMEGIGNEIPFFICPFQPSESNEMGKVYKQLKNQLEHSGISILDVNLYDLSIDILHERGILDRIFEMEENVNKDVIMELLQGVLDSETYLIPEFKKKMEKSEYDILFITGVGEVFPYIRSHNVLNNLQSTAKNKPTVLFFPGSYTFSDEKGALLTLFGRLKNDKYYRAFNIYHCEV